MPKYWGKQIFSLGRFPEVGQKQKTEKKRERETLKVGNKWPGTHCKHHLGWRTQSRLVQNRLMMLTLKYFSLKP